MNMKSLYFQSTLLFLSMILVKCGGKLSCTNYKNGKFFTFSPVTKDKIIVERRDSIQLETNVINGRYIKSKIEWKSPCEYEIFQRATNKSAEDITDSFFAINPIRVNIIAGYKDYYVFTARIDSANKHVEFTDTMRVLN